MTQLGSISNNHLSITCKTCQHHAMLAVSHILKRYHWTESLAHVRERLVCTKCKAQGQNTVQIVFVGGSGQAMLGAGVPPRPDPKDR